MNDIMVSARIPHSLKKLMEKYVALDTHLNESELIRDALREKIQRDAPNLYEKQFEKELEK
jgi:Arc/MetJ-type ribon-helix-helix transcriptional regulator